MSRRTGIAATLTLALVSLLAFLISRNPPQRRAPADSLPGNSPVAGASNSVHRSPVWGFPGQTNPGQLTTNPSNPKAPLIVQELRAFADPAAANLLTLFDRAGWNESEQVARFRETYDQLVRIYFYDDLIAENRLEMRTQIINLGTNTQYTEEQKRELRERYAILQDSFSAELRQRQTKIMSNLVTFLGLPPGMEAPEFERKLREIQPRFPLEGSITNHLPNPTPLDPSI